jgi:hypothetical protein
VFEKDADAMKIDEKNEKAAARVIKSIQCYQSRNKNNVKLFFPTNNFIVKIRDLISELKLAGSDCSDSEIRFFITNNKSANWNTDYVEDIYDLTTITYNNDKSISIKGIETTLTISSYLRSDNKIDCIYSFIKLLLSDVYPYNQNYAIVTPTLDELQYASPCEYEMLKIEDRKILLQEVSNFSNDSRQKIAILLVSTVLDKNKKEFYDFLSKDPKLFNKLYDNVSDYREEFVETIIDLWKYNNTNVTANKYVPISQYSLLYKNTFWRVNEKGNYEICIQHIVGGDPYWTGLKYESKCTDEIRPFDAVNIYLYTSLWSQFSGKEDEILLNVPAFVGRTIISDTYTKEFYNYLTVGFLAAGVNQTAIATKMLANGGLKSIGIWVKIALGLSDVSTIAIEEYVKGNPDAEFSKIWENSKDEIYGFLLIANITDAVVTQYINKIKQLQLDDLYNKEINIDKARKATLLSNINNFPNLKNWINQLDDVADAALINKIDNLVATNPNKLVQLDNLFDSKNFKMPTGNNRIPPNAKPPFQYTVNGTTVNFNSQGFPDFKPHSPGSAFEYKANNLTGIGSATSGDFKAANDWAASNPALKERFATIKNSQRCKIKFGDDWIVCTWHHFQDGRTMFPVPTSLHSVVNHTGGNAIISRGLQDIFY